MPETIRVTRGATINLGNYESARVEISAEVEVAEGQSMEGRIDVVNAEAKTWLQKEAEAIQQAAGLPPRPVERFTG
jgi:hypothetical protein